MAQSRIHTRQLWSAAAEECLLTHIERNKGSDGKWIKSPHDAMNEVLVELKALKPSSAASLTERRITSKLHDIIRRAPRLSQLAKPQDLFIKGPVASNVQGIRPGRSRPDKVLNPQSLEAHELF
jgi:hypothetical protein